MIFLFVEGFEGVRVDGEGDQSGCCWEVQRGEVEADKRIEGIG